MKKGFTLIELMVVIAIIAILSGIILFSVMQYINRGKDSNISGNLAILVPAGEVYYNTENGTAGDGYAGFCGSTVVVNAKSQMPVNLNGNCYDASNNVSGVCCFVDDTNHNAWAACASGFADSHYAYCVDSRGVKKEICNSQCSSNISICPDILNTCP